MFDTVFFIVYIGEYTVTSMMYEMCEVKMHDTPPDVYHNLSPLDAESPDRPEGSTWKCLQCNAFSVVITMITHALIQRGEYN
jgi:hypothetical protein